MNAPNAVSQTFTLSLGAPPSKPRPRLNGDSSIVRFGLYLLDVAEENDIPLTPEEAARLASLAFALDALPVGGFEKLKLLLSLSPERERL